MKRKIAAMQEIHGMDAAHTCRDCCNFVRFRYHDRILRKCKAYGVTSSMARDWAGSWMACGLFGEPFPECCRPLIELLKGGRQTEDAPLEDQCTWEI